MFTRFVHCNLSKIESVVTLLILDERSIVDLNFIQISLLCAIDFKVSHHDKWRKQLSQRQICTIESVMQYTVNDLQNTKNYRYVKVLYFKLRIYFDEIMFLCTFAFRRFKMYYKVAIHD